MDHLSVTSDIAFVPRALDPLPSRPLVSILITNYNYERYLGAALDSALTQTYKNLEVIVCDDGSTDCSREVVQQYQQSDHRVSLICQSNGGMASGLNAAYRRAKGKVVCLLDADDTFYPDKVEQVIDCFHAHPNSGFCVHPVLPVNAGGTPIAVPRPDPFRLMAGWLGPLALRQGGYVPLPPCSGLSFRRIITEELFPVPVQFRRGADGYLMRASLWRTEVSIIPSVLAQYRLHANNVTGSTTLDEMKLEKAAEDERLLNQAQGEVLAAYFGDEIAARLNINDHPYYWDVQLALALVKSSRTNHSDGRHIQKIIDRLPAGHRAMLWRILFAIPRIVALPVLQLWWGESVLKLFIQKSRSRLRAW